MIGDGVNDAPALRRADIGIAMNSGSDASKDASSIILLKNNFTAISHAIQEGRLIFINLRKVIGYQISAGGWSELLPVLAYFFLGLPQPLSSFFMIIISCLTGKLLLHFHIECNAIIRNCTDARCSQKNADVFAGVAIMNEVPEENVLLVPPRDYKNSHLVNLSLVIYAYLFYANMICLGAFYNYFDYMETRGSVTSIPTPIPLDDDPFNTPSALGYRTFPAGYSPIQLLFAWNWTADSSTALGRDQLAAMNTASSVYFVTVVVAQMGHLLSIRSKIPYFAEEILGKEWIKRRAEHDQVAHSAINHDVDVQGIEFANKRIRPDSNDQLGGQIGRGLMMSSSESLDDQNSSTAGQVDEERRGGVLNAPIRGKGFLPFLLEYIRWGVVMAWIGSIAVALIVTESPIIQDYCGTAAVPGKYWLYAFGWSVSWFTIAEIRKWLIFLFPHSLASQLISW